MTNSHQTRLSSTNKDGSRHYIYPAFVKGAFKTFHNRIYFLLILVFLLLPWLKINGQQALFLDVAHRKFVFFGLTLWAHDAPLLALVFLTFVLSIAIITALFGRVWCGWACPQTVFIDFIYRRVERWIEGSAKDQQRLDNAPWGVQKALKKGAKWILFIIISGFITHSFLAYFVGADRITAMVLRPPSENWTSFLFILFSTGIILFDFGWFREQFCIIACPYGRMQSVLMDSDSLIVSYDEKRGEPRQENPKTVKPDSGDCISCHRCVQVCPTGIDIRQGLQLECIMCSACIDACDAVMTKIGKPTGLIKYTSENAQMGKKSKILRVRLFLYGALLSVIVGALVFFISHRDPVRVNIVRSKEAPYQFSAVQQTVINHFKFNLRNQASEPMRVDVKFSDPSVSHEGKIVTPLSNMEILPGDSLRLDVFVHFPQSWLTDGKTSREIELVQTSSTAQESQFKEIKLVGPML